MVNKVYLQLILFVEDPNYPINPHFSYEERPLKFNNYQGISPKPL